MTRENDLVLNLLFLVLVLLMQVGEGQQNRATDVKVGIVDDVGMAHSNMTLFCINMSLSDFYSSHPETRTRLLTTVVDSKKDVVTAAAAGTRISRRQEEEEESVETEKEVEKNLTRFVTLTPTSSSFETGKQVAFRTSMSGIFSTLE